MKFWQQGMFITSRPEFTSSSPPMCSHGQSWRGLFIAQFNSLMNISLSVHQCFIFITTTYSKAKLNKIKVAYNDALRILLKAPRSKTDQNLFYFGRCEFRRSHRHTPSGNRTKRINLNVSTKMYQHKCINCTCRCGDVRLTPRTIGGLKNFFTAQN